MSKKRKIVWVFVAAPLVVIAVMIGRAWISARRVPGIYLAEGGMGCIVITGDTLRGWRIEKDYLNPTLQHRLKSVWPRLRLEGEDGGRYPEEYTKIFARSGRGDWDLVALSTVPVLRPSPGKKETLAERMSRWWLKRLLLVRLTQPLPYLHRLDDRRVVEYFDLLYAENNPSDAFEKARALLENSPDDLHVRLLYLDAAARNDDIKEIAQRLDAWKNDFEKSDNPFIVWTVRRLGVAGRNGYDFSREVLNPTTDLPTRLRLFPKMLEMESYIPPRFPALSYETVPSLLGTQVAVKVFHVVAICRMMEGRREESLLLLASSYRLGQMMSENTTFVEKLIGAAIRGIAARGLEIYTLNCCETTSDFKQLWATLEHLEMQEKPQRMKESLFMEYPVDLRLNKITQPNFLEAATRVDVANAGFELLRMATAGKYRFIAEGDFPESNDQFAPLSKGLPKDPFAKRALRFLSTTDSLVCYSIGPDRRDDGAAVEYDPTNGTISTGDILLRVPREREYPFPREGVRAASVEDLMRQFPNGLPRDPFAYTRGKGLGTTPALAGGIYIYSYGPNVDEFKGQFTGTSHILECPYDPTNGVTSDGDLFIHISPR